MNRAGEYVVLEQHAAGAVHDQRLQRGRETKCVMTHHPECLVLLLKRFKVDYRYMQYVKISSCVDVPFTLQIPENQTYELYGFVDHFGDLSGGHYTATIKSQDDEG